MGYNFNVVKKCVFNFQKTFDNIIFILLNPINFIHLRFSKIKKWNKMIDLVLKRVSNNNKLKTIIRIKNKFYITVHFIFANSYLYDNGQNFYTNYKKSFIKLTNQGISYEIIPNKNR